jgi:hypothetical protein
MTDKYVYHFVGPDGAGGKNVLSARAATLEAIQSRGEPVMESQTVVDQSELDDDGFLVRFGTRANVIDSLWSQIRSLKLRAESRDVEALQLNEATDGERKYMLQLESQELRRQAEMLKAQRFELLTAKFRRDDETDGPLLGTGFMTAE